MKFLSNLFSRITSAPLRRRSYEGAATGRRASGIGSMSNVHGAAQAARVPLMVRARHLEANNAHAAAGVTAWVSAIVGTGIKPQSSHPVPALRLALNSRWTAWTDEADADGLGDAYALQALMVRRMIVDGEAFALTMATAAGLRVRVIAPEQVDASLTCLLANGGRIISGVEFDAAGVRVAYHIFKEQPGLGLGVRLTPVRVPAEDVIHLFRQDFPGQVRGLSWFAPVLMRLADLDEWHGAQLTRQKVGALHTGFVTSMDAGVPYPTEAQGDIAIGGLEPGAMVVLPPGKDVRFSEPPAISDEANAFGKITLHEIAAGLGLPYEVFGDLSSVNYSSIRAGLVEWHRRIEMIQHSTVAFQALRPMWRRWAALEVLSGRIGGTVEEALACTWITPKRQWVDPSKDVAAEIAAIGAGLMSRREAVAARGLDIEEMDSEIATDQARAQALGLSFSLPPGGAPSSEMEAAQ